MGNVNPVARHRVQPPPQDRVSLELELDRWVSVSLFHQREAYTTVKNRIIRCFDNQDVALDLSELNLDQIPTGCWRFLTHLWSLDLSYNDLWVLPAEISSLVQLQQLHLSHNQLAAIPPEIGNLVQLWRVSLSHNRLTVLPVEIGNLVQLMELNLSHNQLFNLPRSIGNLVNLVELDLSYNHLIVLPATARNLIRLQRVDASHNTPLPDARAGGYQGLINHWQMVGGHYAPQQEQSLSPRDALNAITEKLRGLNLLPEAPTEAELAALDIPALGPYLYKITRSRDYERNHPECLLQIYRLICDAAKNENFRRAVAELLAEANAACGDRATLYSSEIEMKRRIICGRMNPPDVAILLLGNYRVQCINAAAAGIAHEIRARDEIEVALKLQLELKQALQLPISVEGMLYESLAPIPLGRIEQLKDEILSQTNTPEKCAECVVQQKTWIDYLDKDPALFRNEVVHAAERLERLDLNGRNYVAECDRIQEEVTAAKRQIALQIATDIFKDEFFRQEAARLMLIGGYA